MQPLRNRAVPILCILVGAPITAEFLQAYLSSTGDPKEIAIGIVFFAPLYGGAALLIREIAVRTRRGWTGVLIIALAFGLAMPGLIDLALFGEGRADIDYWSELREPTLIAPLGISAFTTVSWTVGHAMMSVGAPLALLYSLAPAHRGRPLLGKVGLSVMLIAASVVATAVHQDGQQNYGYVLSLTQIGTVLAVVVGLAILAFTPLGAPLRVDAAERSVPAAAVVVGAVMLKLSVDLLPPTWTGVLSAIAVLIVGAASIHWASRRRRWGPREIGLLGAGVVIGAVLIGFLSPVPPGTSVAAKISQSSVLLVLSLLLLALVIRRTTVQMAGVLTTARSGVNDRG